MPSPSPNGRSAGRRSSRSATRARNSSVSSLQQQAVQKACHELGGMIEGERSSSTFACGGTIPIGNMEEGNSPPVTIFWSTDRKPNSKKLVLPLGEEQDSSPNALKQLVSGCSPATFGRGEKDVLDQSYRLAGKLNFDQFSSTFHLPSFGILENIEQILLPSISTADENALQFRKLSADLYKLNVYSGPTGLFRKHVDTPRSANQVGSLVVCLPSPFEGGNLLVRHQEHEVNFDWGPASDLSIQWAAFYSDCEHEIKTITKGDRVTLTYNLCVTEPVGSLTLPKPIVDIKSLPLYEYLRDLIRQPGFLADGGALGIFCSHAYAHSSDTAATNLPRTLKGSDLVFYAVLKSIGIGVNVLPVMDMADWDRHGEPPSGNCVGNALYSYFTTDEGGYEEEYESKIAKRCWPYKIRRDITWLTAPKHLEYAFTHLAYGNEASTSTQYSYATIIAEFPSWNERIRQTFLTS
ncbi:hypothetical protein ASPWEDRAFT_179400 [Aspergillus wentii DTO 134E9]|uniref:Fe2OG dioxygenase domain-containing protein n=1 Tax=Aspergillus wentii DTO 134E9 TaxID=1073089 RepID=A0A1L9S3H9_ASPWE|nr:uncharacterized protein ASPWEDRAFT_179400 [Aspergillus wentii DTO 134E9]OJJ41693.1 hypothetical protein ASPWEDRAFT_179400 [Aspergillus wentii DTO 134E9]